MRWPSLTALFRLASFRCVIKKSMSAIAVIVNVPREALRQSKSQLDGQNSARQAETLIG